MTERPASAVSAVTTLFWIGAATLYTELMLIRWLGSEIPLLAYFKNLPLLAMLTGFGAGCLRREALDRTWRVSLWALGGLCLAGAMADLVGLHRLMFPEPALDLWERAIADPVLSDLRQTALHLSVLVALLVLSAAGFLAFGQAAGEAYRPDATLRDYGGNLAGSLAGLGLFALLSFARTPPPAWIGTGVVLTAIAAARTGIRIRRVRGPLLLVALALAVSIARLRIPGAVLMWSPYYRIEVRPVFDAGQPPELLRYHTTANHDGEQDTFDLAVGRRSRDTAYLNHWRLMFDLPFLLAPGAPTVLIGGAGTGNDVAAALRHDATAVTAVEIDPGYIEVGRRFNHERPYQSPRVTVVNDDVREVLRRRPGPYDLIVFSILDSSTALSSLGSLRLDNFVYTVEGLREAAARLSARGVMCVSFFVSGKPGDDRTWIARRLDRDIRLATGREPLCTRHGERAFFVFGPGIDERGFRAVLSRTGLEPVRYDSDDIRPSTDDWPFLYSNPRGQPVMYWAMLGLIVLGAFGWFRQSLGSGGAGSPDLPMLLLGAGFMLVEVKAFTELSLLFGATWIVTAAVLAGAVIMSFLGNGLVRRWPSVSVSVSGAVLLASLVLWAVIPHAVVARWPAPFNLFGGSILALLPILFGGVLFSRAFSVRADPRRALAFNLLGLVAGGALEAMSLAFGLTFLTWLAAALYGVGWIGEQRRKG